MLEFINVLLILESAIYIYLVNDFGLPLIRETVLRQEVSMKSLSKERSFHFAWAHLPRGKRWRGNYNGQPFPRRARTLSPPPSATHPAPNSHNSSLSVLSATEAKIMTTSTGCLENHVLCQYYHWTNFDYFKFFFTNLIAAFYAAS